MTTPDRRSTAADPREWRSARVAGRAGNGAGYRERFLTWPEPLHRPHTRLPWQVSQRWVIHVPTVPEPPQLRQRPSPLHVVQVSIWLDHLPVVFGEL
jgi:hypothetical protein